jgi:ABC-type transport system involved in multi-copper enzyme maturation permease subunit
MSLLIASIILELSQDISILLPQLYPSYLIILVVTLAFILTMVTLGVLISGMTQKPIISMTVSLFVWVIIVLALPKVSPMLARIIYPVESEQVVNFRKHMVLDDLQKTYIQESTQIHNKYQHIPEKLMISYFAGKGFHEKYGLSEEEKSVLPLDVELTALRKKNQEQIDNKIGQIVRNHRNKMNKQNAIAMNISRLSPASCYTYLVSGLSNTGPREFEKFIENAQEFQDEVKKAIYDNYEKRATKSFGQTTTLRDPPETVPDMRYRYANMTEILEAGLVDVILSISFTFLFFTLALVTFSRYDVRS